MLDCATFMCSFEGSERETRQQWWGSRARGGRSVAECRRD